jgi:alpha-galactosidase
VFASETRNRKNARWSTVRKHVVVVAAMMAAVLMPVPAAHAASPQFGQFPVMGYNTWYQFGAGLTESAVLQQAETLVSSGLAAAGYDTVNLETAGWRPHVPATVR